MIYGVGHILLSAFLDLDLDAFINHGTHRKHGKEVVNGEGEGELISFIYLVLLKFFTPAG